MIRMVAGRCPTAIALKPTESEPIRIAPIPTAKLSAADLRPALLFAFPGRLSVRGIQDEVADFYGIDREYMRKPDGPGNREPRVSHPRQVAMFLSRELTQTTLPVIGKLFGGRDHSTVIYAIAAVKKRAAADPIIDVELEVLRERMSG
jgi:chromosomal replication initiator protein